VESLVNATERVAELVKEHEMVPKLQDMEDIIELVSVISFLMWEQSGGTLVRDDTIVSMLAVAKTAYGLGYKTGKAEADEMHELRSAGEGSDAGLDNSPPL
jgi:hypothetical protein